MFCCLVYNLWKITNVLECHVTLKNFVARVVDQIRTIIEQVPDG
jgi:hypothetical protein